VGTITRFGTGLNDTHPHRKMTGGIFDPEQMPVVYEAFDQAWAILQETLDDRMWPRDVARLKLATNMVDMEIPEPFAVATLRYKALRLYEAATFVAERG
jgi:hypothetical protein